MPVDRCICFKITFEEIKEIAEGQGYESVEELQENDICSLQCRFCVPYVEKVLETGETIFEPIPFEQ